MSELQAGPSAPDNLDRVEGEGDSPEDAIDFEVGSLSSSERRTLGAVQKLTEAADKVLRSISKPLLQGSKFPFLWHLVNQIYMSGIRGVLLPLTPTFASF